MPTYVAFLRGINLGPVRKFPKADIVAAVEAAGMTDVATYINTGNVRVTTALRSRAKVELALERAFAADRGFEVPTIAFSPAEIATIATEAEEIGAGHDGRHWVSLLKQEPPADATAMIGAAAGEGERAVVRGRAIHLLLGPAYSGAQLTNDAVERVLGVSTNRNITVIRALAEKWCR